MCSLDVVPDPSKEAMVRCYEIRDTKKQNMRTTTGRMQHRYSVLIRTAQFVLQVKWWQAIRYHHVNHHLEEIMTAHIHAEAMHMRDKAIPNQRAITASVLSFPSLLPHAAYTALHQSHPPCLLFLLHRDLFSLAAHFGEPCCLWADLAVAWLPGYVLNRCGLCGISGWLHMLSDDKRQIRWNRSWI